MRAYDYTLAFARRKSSGMRHRFSPLFISPLRAVTVSRGRNAISENRVAPRLFRSFHQARNRPPRLRAFHHQFLFIPIINTIKATIPKQPSGTKNLQINKIISSTGLTTLHFHPNRLQIAGIISLNSAADNAQTKYKTKTNKTMPSRIINMFHAPLLKAEWRATRIYENTAMGVWKPRKALMDAAILPNVRIVGLPRTERAR